MLIKIKARDVHEISWTIRDDDGNLVDLTETQIELHAQQGSRDPLTLPVQVVPPATDGRAVHLLDGQLTPGPWIYELELTRAGQIITSPIEDLLVEADIA